LQPYETVPKLSKSGLGVVQGHWKWHHSIDRIRVPIRHPLWICIILYFYWDSQRRILQWGDLEMWVRDCSR